MFKVAMDLTSSFLVLSEINSKHVYIIHLNGVSGPECEMMALNLAFILGGLQTTSEQFAFPRMQNQLPDCDFVSFNASLVARRMNALTVEGTKALGISHVVVISLHFIKHF